MRIIFVLFMCQMIAGVPVKRSANDGNKHKTFGHFTPRIPTKKVKNLMNAEPSGKRETPPARKKSLDDDLDQRMEDEIQNYHEIQARIKFLENHLSKHANFHLIDDKTLVDAAHTLEEMKTKIINPLEVNLLAVRRQIERSNHNMSNEDKQFIKSLLENADAFLETSKRRLDNMELIEQDWDSEEEAEKIRLATEIKPEPVKVEIKSDQFREVSESLADGLEHKQGFGGLRTQRLRKIKKIVSAKKEEVHRTKQTKEEQVKIDIHKIKQELEREKIMDEEPGYAKKIKKAMEEAAEQSHKFIHEKLSHGHPSEEASLPSWSLVFVLSGISAMLLLVVIYLLLFRRNLKPWRRNLFKGEEKSNGYCELNDVRGESQTGIANPWNEGSSWSSWNVNAQKLK